MARILIGEANPNLRELYVALLEQLGHEAIVMDGGPAAPPSSGELLLIDPTSTILLDQARIVREWNPTLPIVFTGILSAEAGFVTLGPNRHLAKPFTLDGLNTVIEAAFASVRRSPRNP